MLSDVTLPDSLKSIYYEAFTGCSSLKKLKIPKDVETIVVNFIGCDSLLSFEVDPKNKTFKSSNGILYSKNEMRLIACPPGKSGSLTIPDKVTRIEHNSFAGCNLLTEITLPHSVKKSKKVQSSLANHYKR